MKKTLIILVLITIAGFLGARFFVNQKRSADNNVHREERITVYKSPSCGCCDNYVTYLKKRGFEVEVVEKDDLSSIKEEYQIPMRAQSCHTALVGDYFIEGHVPVGAITKLLEEKPDVAGIILPGMPEGSPGMPGIKNQQFQIYSLKNGELLEYMRL
jgi:hypothetical protein